LARSGTIALDRGVHTIFVQFAQQGGAFDLQLSWARDDGALTPVPAWALTTARRVTFARFMASVVLRVALAVAEWFAVAAMAAWLATIAWRWFGAAREWGRREGVWPALALMVGGSIALNAVGVWWGLPGGSWMPDELTPGVVRAAAAQKFWGGGADRYPPLHFYLLYAAESPVLALQRLGRLPFNSELTDALLAIAGRLVSVAGGAVTVACAYL